MELGHIYVIRHPNRAAGFKVGKTTREVQVRLRELNADSTLVGGTMELIGYWIVEDVDEAEKAAHLALSDLRKQANREFFGGSLEEIYKRAHAGIEKWVLKQVGFEEVQKETPTSSRSSTRQAADVDFQIAAESDARFVINEEYKLHVRAMLREANWTNVMGPGPNLRGVNRALAMSRPTLEGPMQSLVDFQKKSLFYFREAKRVKVKISPDEPEESISLSLRPQRKFLTLYAEARFHANQSVYAEVQSDIGELATAIKYTECLEALAHQNVLLSCFEVLKNPRPAISIFDSILNWPDARFQRWMRRNHDERVEAARMKLTASGFGGDRQNKPRFPHRRY